jgi:hypothetical protein
MVVNVELLGSDLALLQVSFSSSELSSSFHRFPWFVGQPPVFETVRSVGYAYGIHRLDGRQSCVVRGFQGHIVSGLLEFKPIGMRGEPFEVYELSFSAPRGLSGAPLLNAVGRPVILGVVIGNSESRMLVFRSEEKVTEPDGQFSVEQYESLQLGIAVQGKVVLAKQSSLLGSSIEEHLRSQNLLVRP